MEVNSITQMINDMVMNGDIVRTLPIHGEISIADVPGIKTIITDALVTGIITGIATYLGSKIGSKRTIELFKEEQKLKVSEPLRREFYFEYEKIYLNMRERLKNLISSIGLMRLIIYKLEDADSSEYIKVEDLEIIKSELYELGRAKEDANDYLENTLFYITKLKDFMDLKDYISGYEEFKYTELENNISSFKERTKYMLKPIDEKEFDNIDDKEAYRKGIEDIINGEYFNLIDQFKRIKDIHKGISKEFMGVYFKD